VIWNQHAREMSDLASTDQRQLLDTVLRIEALLRSHLAPDKINLASLGNMVPHVHWHIIPRWQDDAHWPGPVWATRQRDGVAHGAGLRPAIARAIADALAVT
jgi:diadenosine tetraphosphate (Ap4A) HIT family hydrolase